jgi:hypothetical protein
LVGRDLAVDQQFDVAYLHVVAHLHTNRSRFAFIDLDARRTRGGIRRPLGHGEDRRDTSGIEGAIVYNLCSAGAAPHVVMFRRGQ